MAQQHAIGKCLLQSAAAAQLDALLLEPIHNAYSQARTSMAPFAWTLMIASEEICYQAKLCSL